MKVDKISGPFFLVTPLSAFPQTRAARLRAAIFVAHPDDEALWAGGFILDHPHWDWFIAGLCRASDPDRAPKFLRALERLQARGALADLDDGPEQWPLAPEMVQQQILKLLPSRQFDVLVTHGWQGEYTWHRRHVEVHQAITALWRTGQLSLKALWLFAYEDGGRKYLPRAQAEAHFYYPLSTEVWRAKYDLITTTYGFRPESWEARTTPKTEAFWCFATADELDQWLTERAQPHEDPSSL